MKQLTLLLAIFPLTLFAQITEENGVCSQPVEGGSLQWGCTFTPDPVEPPVPVAPYSKLVCIGDSWTDDAGSRPDRQHPKWCTKLAERYGIPRDLVAVRGWTTGQILNLVTNHLASVGGDPNALYAYWIFPNDFGSGQINEDDWNNALPGITANIAETFTRIKNAGGENFLLLNFPDADLLPETAGAPASYVNQFSASLNAAYAAGLAQVNESAAYYDINPLFRAENGPVYVQSDGRHPTEAMHEKVAAELEGAL